MSESTPGVVIRNKFVVPKSRIFSGYIKYIGRDEAIRNDSKFEFNTFQDYMGNPEKTTGLFTADKDLLTFSERDALKEVFQKAQDKGSLMWQTVISFDNSWLEKWGLYNSSSRVLLEPKIKEATRAAMKSVQKDEELENAVWSASIHYNTDNIHVHIAMVEPEPMRQRMEEGPYEGEFRGKLKPKTIRNAKSKVVNTCTDLQQENERINELIRDNMVQTLKDSQLVRLKADLRLRREFYALSREINAGIQDKSKTGYAYNSNQMKPYREKLDRLADEFIQTYCADDYEELKKLIYDNAEKYREAYGNTKRDRAKEKFDELHVRMGNVLINEMRKEQLREERENGRRRGSSAYGGSVMSRPLNHGSDLIASIATAMLSETRDMKEKIRKEREYEEEQRRLEAERDDYEY